MGRRAVVLSFGLILVALSSFKIVRSSYHYPAPPFGRLIATESAIVLRGTWSGESSQQPEARFEVRNVGGRAVRIISVESGCGCAVPTVEPKLIAPGKQGRVAVRAAAPPVGERTVLFTVHTDSPLTPEVRLQLTIIGERRPPFLLRVEGDLTYRDDGPAEGPRKVAVLTVEPSSRSQAPVPTIDLPFFKWAAQGCEESPYLNSGAILRRYTFTVAFTERPPPGAYSGACSVVDPWNPAHLESLPIHGEEVPPVRVIPAQVALALNGPDDHATTARVLVLREDLTETPVVEPEESETSPLTVAGAHSIKNGRLVEFTVRVRAGREIAPGVYHLIARPAAHATARVRIPVTVRWEVNHDSAR